MIDDGFMEGGAQDPLASPGRLGGGRSRAPEIKQPVWLMSFADFAGCLLASFVLLYSLAQTDRVRMQAAFGIAETPKIVVGTQGGPDTKSMTALPVEDGKDTDYLATLLQTKVAADPALGGITVEPLPDKVALSLPLARLTADATAGSHDGSMLNALASLLSVVPNDSALVAELPQLGPGNWTKGMTLANALSQRLRDSGAPDNISARVGASTDPNGHVRLVIFRDSATQ
jgi:flagellar motor protein MotB